MIGYTRISGVTMVEVMATLVIMATITVLTIPSLRSFQGRQELLTSQKGIQSFLYRMHQLALAPTDSKLGGAEAVGYGLAIVPKITTGASLQLGGGRCFCGGGPHPRNTKPHNL